MAKKNTNKSFKDWTYEEVNEAFGLVRIFTHKLFDFFYQIDFTKTESNAALIENLRSLAFKYGDSWNEDEYKFLFISPFIGLANFTSDNYKIFTQRQLSVKYENDTKITDGLVEFMLAKGIQQPKKPHLFLHEYKPEKRRDNDPLGQLLIGMVAAQKINQDEKPIYGIYVVGRYWYFVILENQQYVVSNSFNATDKEDIFRLFAILQFFKQEMETLYSGL